MARVTRELREQARLKRAQYIEEMERRHREEREQEKLRETKTAELLSGLEIIEEGELLAGKAIAELRRLGLKAKEIEEISGHTAKEQSDLMDLAADHHQEDESDDAELSNEEVEELDSEVKEKEESPVTAKASAESA